MKQKIIIAIAIVVAVGALLLLINNLGGKETEENLQEVSVRLKWLDQAQFAGYYVANSKGYYQDNNLKVAINPGGPNISPVQMVVNGTDDFGITSGNQIILAREQGIPVVAIAVIYQKSPIAIISLKEKNIIEPQDLVDKKVGIVYSDDDEIIFKALLDKEGLSNSNIDTEAKTFDLSQLKTGRTDAEVVYENNEPYLLNKDGLATNLIKPRDYGINFYGDTIFTTEKIISENPELVKKFINATIKGWIYAIENPEYAVDETVKINTSLDRDHQLEFLKSSIPLIKTSKIGSSSDEEWHNMLQTLIRQGLVEKVNSTKDIYNNAFLE